VINSSGKEVKIALVYAGYVEKYISETVGSEPKAWLRKGPQNISLSWNQRKQLEREKGIENYEESFCCDFDKAEVDEQVIREFRQSYSGASIGELDATEMLYQAGALRKNQSGDLYFTNAGYLFFSSNPRRVRHWAYLRLLRFDEKIQNSNNRGPQNFEKEFDGPITQQIQRFRAFVKESGFFKSYQRRKPSGGFSEEPELPMIAIDEAVVNAIAHRDYAIQRPIEIVKYEDALVVNNPGRVQQRDQQLPEKFTLEDYRLNSAPRNPRLIEWLKQMEDSDGQPYVLAISEGTKRMKDEMEELDLPAPEYQHNQTETKLTLYNNIEERKRRYKSEAQASKSTEFVNLFPVHLFNPEEERVKPGDIDLKKSEISSYLRDSLEASGWYIDRSHFGRLTFHLPGSEKKLQQSVRNYIRLYPAYEAQIRTYWNNFYFLIDYTLEVKNVQNALQLLGLLKSDDLEGRDAVARLNGKWHKGHIKELSKTKATVQLRESESRETLQPTDVIPRLSMRQLKMIAQDIPSNFNLSREVKKHSLSGVGAARQRAKKTIEAVESIASTVFPLRIRDLTADLKSSPVSLARNWDDYVFERHTLPEPPVEFRSQSETTNIRDGITQYGAYEDQPNQVTIVPICLDGMRDEMKSLLRRLREGKYKYRGSERTFSTKLEADFISTVPDSEDLLGECRRLLDNHPTWVGSSDNDRIFLVHTPSDEYSKDDVSSPYYMVKRFLLENGIPCQMVDTPTLEDPDWKDLNLALNIAAKCGVTPWVLPNRIPDADVFVGLSYTRKQDEDSRRLMGYSTVFNDS